MLYMCSEGVWGVNGYVVCTPGTVIGMANRPNLICIGCRFVL